MIENGRISPRQFGLLIFLFELGSTAILTPSFVVSIAKQDAWLSIILTIVVCVLLASLWFRLARIYPNESVIQYSEHILGKWFGKLVGILYISFFLFLGALVLRNLGDFVTTNVLTETPIQFVHIMFMLPVIYGTYLGIEVLARTAEVLIPWVMSIFVITLLFLLKPLNLSAVLPILPEGLMPAIKAMYPVLGFPIAEIVICLMFLPLVNRPRTAKLYLNLFFVFAKIVVTIVVLLSISVLGVDLSARSPFAIFEVARHIRVGEFLERVEVLVGAIWIITIYVKLSLCFYAANLATAQFFHLKNYRSTILPFGMLLIPLSILAYDDQTEVGLFAQGPYPIYALFFGLFLPALLLITAKIRKLKSD